MHDIATNGCLDPEEQRGRALVTYAGATALAPLRLLASLAGLAAAAEPVARRMAMHWRAAADHPQRRGCGSG